jgi:translation initiation factor 1
MSAADLGGFSLPTGPNLGGFDPFQQEDGKSSKKSDVKEHVHIRVQQRNGKKSLTTVQGLPKEFDLKKILKALKKEYCCNGCVVEDEEAGKVLQLQGDQRKNVSTFVVENKLVKKDSIKIHGF